MGFVGEESSLMIVLQSIHLLIFVSLPVIYLEKFYDVHCIYTGLKVALYEYKHLLNVCNTLNNGAISLNFIFIIMTRRERKRTRREKTLFVYLLNLCSIYDIRRCIWFLFHLKLTIICSSLWYGCVRFCFLISIYANQVEWNVFLRFLSLPLFLSTNFFHFTSFISYFTASILSIRIIKIRLQCSIFAIIFFFHIVFTFNAEVTAALNTIERKSFQQF